MRPPGTGKFHRASLCCRTPLRIRWMFGSMLATQRGNFGQEGVRTCGCRMMLGYFVRATGSSLRYRLGESYRVQSRSSQKRKNVLMRSSFFRELIGVSSHVTRYFERSSRETFLTSALPKASFISLLWSLCLAIVSGPSFLDSQSATNRSPANSTEIFSPL